MKTNSVGLFLVALLLISSILSPSIQQAFAVLDVILNGTTETITSDETHGNLTIENSATLIVQSGTTLSLTGILTIENGGKLIVENDANIELVGNDNLNGIVNQIGGDIDQFGTITNENPLTLILVNQGSWIVFCGILELNGLQWTGTPATFECIEEIILPITEVPEGTTYVVDDQGGKIVVIENNLLVKGLLLNSGFLSNRALITLDDSIGSGTIDLSGGGTLQNVCGNFLTRGLTGSGDVMGANNIVLTCNSPTANDDNYSVDEDNILSEPSNGILFNDVQAVNENIPGDDPTLFALLLSTPSNGVASVNIDGSFTYSPSPEFFGNDFFSYSIVDGNGGIDSATVFITINSVNDSPTANDDVDSTDEDTPVTIPVLDNDSDLENDPLTVTDSTDGSNGSTTTDGTTVTYTPNADFFGSDSFTYTMTDDDGSDSATVTINVAMINDPPKVSIISPLNNDAFLVGESITFVGSALDTEDGILSSNLDWFSNLDGALGTGESLTLLNLSEGIHNIQTTTSDSNGSSDTDFISITVQVDLSTMEFCDNKTIHELEKYANKGKYNLINNRNGPSTTLTGTDKADLIFAGDFGDIIEGKGGNDCIIRVCK